MITSSRALIVLCLNVLVLAPIGVGSAFSETQEKEGATDTKSHPAPAPKVDTSTEHKEAIVPEKPVHHARSTTQPIPTVSRHHTSHHLNIKCHHSSFLPSRLMGCLNRR